MTDLAAATPGGFGGVQTLAYEISSLKAEVLALLLEPLGVDATVGLAPLEQLVEMADVVAKAHGCAATPPSGTTVQWVADAVAVLVRERDLAEMAAPRGRSLTLQEARVVRELMQVEGLRHHFQALEGATVEALRADLASVALAERLLPRLLLPCHRAKKEWPKELRPSILAIDIDRAATDLRRRRRGGRQTAGARELVLNHGLPAAGDLGNDDLAARLEKVRGFVAAKQAYDAALSAQPDWWRWLGSNTRFTFRSDRRDALIWAIEVRDSVVVAASALEMLADGNVRTVIERGFATETTSDSPPATPPATSSASRLWTGLLAIASRADLSELRALEPWFAQNVQSFDRVAAAMDARRSDRALGDALASLADQLAHPLGALDPSRSEYRDVQSALRAEVETRVHRTSYSAHAIENEYLAGVIGRIGANERELRDAVRAMPPTKGGLVVAIAGRTKSGKTTLRKALTRDADRAGIGRGAHRTTRETTAFELESVTYLDTPGIAAKDDDFDAQRAREAYDLADAIIWIYADTLRDEESAELRRLLRSGKPLVAVVNVKDRVDTRERLELFVKHPTRAFKSAPGHFARIEQVARSVGVKPPNILAVHSGAAHESLSVGEHQLGDAALRASRLHELEQALAQLLAERSIPLRAVRLAESIRARLAAFHERAAEEFPQIDLALGELERSTPSHRAELIAAIQVSGQSARDLLDAKRQVSSHQLQAVIPKLGRTDHKQRWRGFIDSLELEGVISGFQDEFEQEVRKRQRVLRTQTGGAERQSEQRLLVRRRPDATVWRRIGAGAAGATKALLSSFTARGIVKRLAAGAASGPAAPWVTTVGYVADGLAGAARAVEEDVQRTRQETHDWAGEAAASAEVAVERLFDTVESRLNRFIQDVTAGIATQFDAQLTDINSTRGRFMQLLLLRSAVQSALDSIDLILARRLLSLAGGHPSELQSARRTPGVELRIWTDARRVESVRASLQDRFVDVLTERIEIAPVSGKVVALATSRRGKGDTHD